MPTWVQMLIHAAVGAVIYYLGFHDARGRDRRHLRRALTDATRAERERATVTRLPSAPYPRARRRGPLDYPSQPHPPTEVATPVRSDEREQP